MGKYAEQLNLVALEKGGRTAAHKHGGIETIVVLEGSVQVRLAGAQPVTLTKGKGLSIAPNTALQAINTGDGTAKFLAFFATLDGQPFSTNVDTAPEKPTPPPQVGTAGASNDRRSGKALVQWY